MSRIAKQLARLPVAERRKIEGIGPRRAEIVVAGAMVYQELLDRFRLKGFRYSPLACATASWRRWPRNMTVARSQESRSSPNAGIDCQGRQALWHRPETCTGRARVRACFVRGVAIRAPAAARIPEWLSAAAMLYEVGDFINRTGRHRHTHYIISNSEILDTHRNSAASSRRLRVIWENRARR